MLKEIIDSWSKINGTLFSLDDILEWISDSNKINVNIKKIDIEECIPWIYDKNTDLIINPKGNFFSIGAINDGNVEQPIILQNEIGYLGIICKEINGTLYFLMQAKIEPGNINKIQISPTIQATKSNFMQKHGGKKPAYLNYFINAQKYEILVDQIQSEQSSRFLKKRNRNIIIKVDENIEVLSSHKWMTLGQIKQLMKMNNIVNMDTRTVISCIPFCLYGNGLNLEEIAAYFTDKSLFESIFIGCEKNSFSEIYHYINNHKMFSKNTTKLIGLSKLEKWEITKKEIVCKDAYGFKVIFCDIEIEGREVKHWEQPLFEAIGSATFGLFTCKDESVKKFLVQAIAEIGCFDKIELGPTIQKEQIEQSYIKNCVEKLFYERLENKQGIKFDTFLSEEGGRFYHEENRNIIIEINKTDIQVLPEGYFWVDFKTLNALTQINNIINIQLRNLLSVLDL